MNGAGPLGDLVGWLDEAGVPYMVVGSIAASSHGFPRTTQDVDLVVELDLTRYERLQALLDPAQWYVADEAAHDALAVGGQFNVVQTSTGWKVDLMIRRNRPFSATEFGRREEVDIGGLRVWVASLEDTILAKLEWARDGGSARQIEDVAQLLAVAASEADDDYLDHWAEELGVTEELAQARAQAGG